MDYAIYTENLTKKFGEFIAVNNVSLKIKQGSIYGLLGSNGSGKSTTIRMLCGILKPTSGKIYLWQNENITDELKLKIGYMSQKFSLYPSLTIKENIKFYANLYGLNEDLLNIRMQKIMEMAGIVDKKDYLVSQLSGGWKQRLALGCAIIHKPKLLFLDEPTSGADPKARKIFWQIIEDLIEQNITVIVTTHFMEEAELCHKIGFLHAGKLLIEDTPLNIKKSVADENTSLNKVFALLVKHNDDVQLQADVNDIQLAPEVVRNIREQLYTEPGGKLNRFRYMLWWRNNLKYQRDNDTIIIPYERYNKVTGSTYIVQVKFVLSKIYESNPDKAAEEQKKKEREEKEKQEALNKQQEEVIEVEEDKIQVMEDNPFEDTVTIDQ